MIALTDLLVRVRPRLANRLSLAGYWKFNTSLMEIRDFRDRLESLIKRAFVGAVTRNRWWVSLKHRIRDSGTKYGRQLNLDRPRKAKSIEDRLSRVVAGGDSLVIELARKDLEHGTGFRSFGSYLADFSHLGAAEAASCEGVITECKVRDVLKQVGLNKSPGQNG